MKSLVMMFYFGLSLSLSPSLSLPPVIFIDLISYKTYVFPPTDMFMPTVAGAQTVTAEPFTTSISTSVCPKCSIKKNEKSGRPSCCYTGGAWYKNCGEPGDSNFDHTWFEGIKACKRMFITCLLNVKRLHLM